MASPSRAPPPRHSSPLTNLHAPQTRTRPTHASGTATPEGSHTTTITSHPTQPTPHGLVLRLRGAHDPQSQSHTQTVETNGPQSTRRSIQWAEGVIDNEGLGRKKSKVCCIYHKTREFGESSSEEDSDSDSSSTDEGDDSGVDDGGARPVGGYSRGRRSGKSGKGKGHGHGHGDDDGCDGHGHGHGHDHGGKGKRKPSPNAYERMPRYEVKPLHGLSGT